jgi:deoxyribose-phosphate aldolase
MSAAGSPSGGSPGNVGDDDVQRIVRRVASIIMQSAGQDGEACNNLACAFCKTCAETDPAQFRRLVEMGVGRIGHRPGAGEVPAEVARYIDHTLLRPDATEEEISRLCAEAKQYQFATVCVNPTYVRLAADLLKGTSVKVCSVVGFPLGAHLPQVKAAEARQATRAGAREIDMVINIGALKSGDDELVYRDIAAVVDACREGRASCKVIIEAAMLTDEEKVRACELAKRARADYVKTSTGFGPGGATPHDVALMSETVRGTKMGVKAAGGIRSFAQAQEMIDAGATRIGASCGVAIVKESKGVTVSP